MNRKYSVLLGMLAITIFAVSVPAANANTLQVGPGKQYAAPCAAIAAAAAGDTIQIDTSVTYSGDVCQWNTNSLTLIGVGGGRAVINAAGQNSQGKAIWVISGNNTVVENIEFTGATVTDLNGAGIRAEGTNLTIRNCYFHDNQEGILTDGGNSTIIIEFSEFFRNGAGDGFSHNLYIGNITKFIFRYNYSHGAIIGHLLKSRAAENDIYYNRLTDESAGTASYEIDIPNGGLSYIVGNLVEKGPLAQNSALVSYQEEGANSGNPDHELFVVNNTMVNDHGQGTFIVVDGSVTVPAIIKDNIFQGSGTITTQSSAVKANNFAGNAILASPTTYDYHLQATSPAINAGADPGTGAGVSLTPAYQYVHPSCAEARTTTGSAIDIGGYEFNGGNGVPPPNAPPTCGASSTPAPAVSFSPTGLSFGSQMVSTTSSTQSITLTNTGNAALTISGIILAGTNPGDFQQTNSCGSSLAAGSQLLYHGLLYSECQRHTLGNSFGLRQRNRKSANGRSFGHWCGQRSGRGPVAHELELCKPGAGNDKHEPGDHAYEFRERGPEHFRHRGQWRFRTDQQLRHQSSRRRALRDQRNLYTDRRRNTHGHTFRHR